MCWGGGSSLWKATISHSQRVAQRGRRSSASKTSGGFLCYDRHARGGQKCCGPATGAYRSQDLMDSRWWSWSSSTVLLWCMCTAGTHFPIFRKLKSEHTQNSWTCFFISQFLQPGATFCKALTSASCIRSSYNFGLVMCSHTFIMLPEYLSLTWHNLQTACSCQRLYRLVFGWLVDS